ncbi:MAG: tRNA (N6-threonylcarbamoyladenosine(37)-N6)-methyltransferase TrmO, partial [Candidatus Brocadiae bacterium]|nr:tRNA (N6-threonylcarbamoyladenosine(37)-N6)-methyltransferase TrmO [Candidatus Brocadiia bacterium]
MDIEAIGKVCKQCGNEVLLEIVPKFKEGLCGIAAGDRLQVLYWMHELPADDRKVLKVHPRGNRSRPLKGVFGLRSP